MEKKSGGKDTQNSEGEVSNFVSRAEFQNITYWNHDTTPSAEDSLPRCFHWLTVANAVRIISSPEIHHSVSCPLDIHDLDSFVCLYCLSLGMAYAVGHQN